MVGQNLHVLVAVVKRGEGTEPPAVVRADLVQAGVVHGGEGGGGHGASVGVFHLQRPPLGRAGAEFVAEGRVFDLQFFVVPAQFESLPEIVALVEADEAEVQVDPAPVGLGRSVPEGKALVSGAFHFLVALPAAPKSVYVGQRETRDQRYFDGFSHRGRAVAYVHVVVHAGGEFGFRHVEHGEGGRFPGRTVGVRPVQAIVANGPVSGGQIEAGFALGDCEGILINGAAGGAPAFKIGRLLKRDAGKLVLVFRRAEQGPVGEVPFAVFQRRPGFRYRCNGQFDLQIFIRACGEDRQGIGLIDQFLRRPEGDDGFLTTQNDARGRVVRFSGIVRDVGFNDVAEAFTVLRVLLLRRERDAESALSVGFGGSVGYQFAVVAAPSPPPAVADLFEENAVIDFSAVQARAGVEFRFAVYRSFFGGKGKVRPRQFHPETGAFVLLHPETDVSAFGPHHEMPGEAAGGEFEFGVEAAVRIAGHGHRAYLLVVHVQEFEFPALAGQHLRHFVGVLLPSEAVDFNRLPRAVDISVGEERGER